MSKKNKASLNSESSTSKFRPGPAGTCEAHLFEFSNECGSPAAALDAEKTIDTTHRIEASSMLEAVTYMAEHEPEFRIWSVRTIGVIVLLSESRYD